MGFHTLAYFEVTDRAATDNDEAALTGTADYVQNGHHILPYDMQLLATLSMGISTSRVRLDAPILRQRSRLDLWPFDRAAIPSEYAGICWFDHNPIQLRAAEEIVVNHSGNGVTGTNENWTTILFAGDGKSPIPRGQPTIIRATGTTTLTANAWTNVPLTFSESLPAGIWEITGFQAFSANAQAARLVIPGQWARPGCIAAPTDLGVIPSRDFMEGRLGSYGRFNTTSLPSVEVLSNAADTAETCFFKLVKVG